MASNKVRNISDGGSKGSDMGLERPPRQTVDGERLLAVFSQLVEPIGRSLPASSEVVLHDLSLLPNSIVAVYGDVTGRRVGDPATDLLLRGLSSGHFETTVGYETKLPDGRRLKSSTMIIRDVSGNAVAAFCINSDISVWQSVAHIASLMVGANPPVAGAVAPPAAVVLETETHGGADLGEVFVKDVDELAALLMCQAIAETGVPVELMHKTHKVEVVRNLKARGMFLLRDAVEMIASSLNCTRFTIYNYLNEINAADEAAEHGGDDGEPVAASGK
ncbi:helix-turn-helix transcriptional regulator [Pseudarthrobacter sp. P1]|uniref:helix-turn-helix transcriptional regulator n=1 Tax=Pseudarthrobacter sp. P1 TaxID=3418418 RepID=UPI003CF61232